MFDPTPAAPRTQEKYLRSQGVSLMSISPSVPVSTQEYALDLVEEFSMRSHIDLTRIVYLVEKPVLILQTDFL